MLPLLIWTTCLMSAGAQTTQPARPRVLLISVDGLRPDLILRCQTPYMHALFEGGSFSFWAKTTPGSITLPSHVSMLTGVVPEVHGILWNGDLPLTKPVYPNSATLFQLAKKAGYTTAMVAAKSKFNVLDVPGSLDFKYVTTDNKTEDREIARRAVDILRSHQPEVMFVHFAGADVTGHASGWGSAEQRTAIEEIDTCIGEMLEALEGVGLRKSTIIILSADHGGQGRTHGPEDVRSRTIPWIINGPGVRKNYDLTLLGHEVEISTYDTFPTLCAILGIKPEKRLEGKFVVQAFENQELLNSSEDVRIAPATPTQGN